MDFHKLLSARKLLLKRYWFPISVGLLGLIFFVYGLIALLAGSKTASDEIVFEAGKDSVSAETASDSGKTNKAVLAVDIEGAVANPGVYSLPLGSRVKDILISSSGLSADADRNWVAKNLNLAKKVSDGEKIYIPRIGENIANQVGVSGSINGLININSASKEQLDSLPGIGLVTVEKIINLRPYSDINELLSKKAVSSKVFEEIKERITAY